MTKGKATGDKHACIPLYFAVALCDVGYIRWRPMEKLLPQFGLTTCLGMLHQNCVSAVKPSLAGKLCRVKN